MGEPPRVSVVIVAARRADRLAGCLAALRARLAETAIPTEVVIVLNGADDAVRALVARADSMAGATIVDAPITLGFADGANLGVEAAAGELVLLLHDDAEPQPGWLEPLVELLDTRPEAGAVGGLVLLPDGSPQLAGALLWNDGTTAPSWGAGEPRLPDRPIAVDYAGSASLLVRRAVWQLVGGTDPDLHPAYYVDVDLMLRLRDAGFAVYCEPRSRVLHHKSSSTTHWARELATLRNRERILLRWGPLVERQAAPGDAAAGLEAAAERASAAALIALPPPAPPAPGPPSPERLLAGARREIAFRTALNAHMEAELAALEERVKLLDETAVRSHADAVRAVRAYEQLHAELERLRAGAQ